MQFAGLARRMPRALRAPLGPGDAAREAGRRLAAREANFLRMASRCIYGAERSPYRKLLASAGCEEGDLARLVEREGLEGALGTLRNAGVRIDAGEFRGERPIRRNGLTVETGRAAFGNPVLARSALEGRTSGTSSPSISAHYTWRLFREEAAAEALLFECHRLRGRPLAFYMPGPPAIAGLHNLLLHLSLGEPPRRWFSQLPPPRWFRSPVEAAAATFIRWCARSCGGDAPRIEHAPPEEAARVVEWMMRPGDPEGGAVMKTYASSAVRLAAATVDAGSSGEGRLIFTGGEPLSRRRYDFIRGAGFAVFPRYAATEAGMLGGACGRGERHDEVHLYTDRIAVIPAAPEPARPVGSVTDLLFTSLSTSSPRILFNASIGDTGELVRRRCDCPFGRIGMELHLRRIGSAGKMSVEGMTIPSSTLGDLVRQVVCEAGGSPDDAQVRLVTSAEGVDRIRIAVHPRVIGFDDEQAKRDFRSRLAKAPGGAALAADLWDRAGTVEVVREPPRATAGDKLPAVVVEGERSPRAAADRADGE